MPNCKPVLSTKKGFFARPKILPELRAWAEEVGCCAPLRAYARGFLLGTVTGAEAPKTAEKATAAAPPPPLMMIGGAGHEGLRELVGEFVGLTKEKLREARNAREVLAHMVALGLGDREELGEDEDETLGPYMVCGREPPKVTAKCEHHP